MIGWDVKLLGTILGMYVAWMILWFLYGPDKPKPRKKEPPK